MDAIVEYLFQKGLFALGVSMFFNVALLRMLAAERKSREGLAAKRAETMGRMREAISNSTNLIMSKWGNGK